VYSATVCAQTGSFSSAFQPLAKEHTVPDSPRASRKLNPRLVFWGGMFLTIMTWAFTGVATAALGDGSIVFVFILFGLYTTLAGVRTLKADPNAGMVPLDEWWCWLVLFLIWPLTAVLAWESNAMNSPKKSNHPPKH
jgi:hypothetical protein